jgi:uncharacterized protein YndB with AHSA1/START domain
VSATVRPPIDRVLTIARVFDAPRDLVWRAWTDPKHLMSWWGPRAHPAENVEADVRVGGRWRHCLRAVGDGSELRHGGVFREVVPPERLVFTFAWEEEGERGIENVVTVTFAEQGAKTLMTMQQTPFQSFEERDGHQGGWGSAFDRLDEFLARANGGATRPGGGA